MSGLAIHWNLTRYFDSQPNQTHGPPGVAHSKGSIQESFTSAICHKQPSERFVPIWMVTSAFIRTDPLTARFRNVHWPITQLSAKTLVRPSFVQNLMSFRE